MELNNYFLKIKRARFDRMPQEIVLLFMKRNPHLPLNILQTK